MRGLEKLLELALLLVHVHHHMRGLEKVCAVSQKYRDVHHHMRGLEIWYYQE